jgi:hypothetical protein
VPVLFPLVDRRVHAQPLSDIYFLRCSIVTACVGGHIRCWTLQSGNDDDDVEDRRAPMTSSMSPTPQQLSLSPVAHQSD